MVNTEGKSNVNNQNNRAAVLTISDKGYRGEREDTSGPALVSFLTENNWEVVYTKILPDEEEQIRRELMFLSDEAGINLILTTGGTGLSPRDMTPEATLSVAERLVPGIPEAMRAKSMEITKMGCLSRAQAGIRKQSLIVNLPGSKKAALENLEAVIAPIRHGVDMLCSSGSGECGVEAAIVLSVNISKEKGTVKTPIDEGILIPNHGLFGDAHAGNWHRQVSLLGIESVRKAEQTLGEKLEPGVFAENLLTQGIVLYTLPVGTRLQIGTAILEVTQIGKECHQGCEIRKRTGDCVMPREGIFAKVIREGHVKASDRIRVIS